MSGFFKRLREREIRRRRLAHRSGARGPRMTDISLSSRENHPSVPPIFFIPRVVFFPRTALPVSRNMQIYALREGRKRKRELSHRRNSTSSSEFVREFFIKPEKRRERRRVRNRDIARCVLCVTGAFFVIVSFLHLESIK